MASHRGVLPIKIHNQGPNIKVSSAEGQVIPSHKRRNHDTELGSQDFAFRPGFLGCFSIVDKKSYNIKHAGEPGYDKNDVQCFYIKITHRIIHRSSLPAPEPKADVCSGRGSSHILYPRIPENFPFRESLFLPMFPGSHSQMPGKSPKDF